MGSHKINPLMLIKGVAGSGSSYDRHPFTFCQAVLAITIWGSILATAGLAIPVWLLALWYAEKHTKNPVLRSDEIVNHGSVRTN